MAVERLDGSFRWAGCAGDATPDGAPMRADTPFFIASVTKLYIAAAVMRLHERGCIALDKPISEYLPPALIGGLHTLDGVDYTGAVTVRHLLSHTSGLPDYIEERPKGGRTLLERLVSEGDRAWGLDEVVGIVRRLTPHFPPQPSDAKRRKARYSDTNYRLLIAIIETAAALPLHLAFEEMLFRPLDLRHTCVAGHDSLDPTPHPATLWFGNQPLELPQAMRSFGDLYSTIGDMARFLRSLIRGEVFDSPVTFGAMQQRWVRFGFPLDAAALRAPGWPIEYGLGIMRFQLPRIFAFGYQMPAVVGHTGSTGCWLFHCPKLDVILSGTVDQVTAGAMPYRIVPKILRIIESSARSTP